MSNVSRIRFKRKADEIYCALKFRDTEELFEGHEIFDEHHNYLCEAQQLIDEIEGRPPRDYEADECPCYICGCTLYRMRENNSDLHLFRNEEELYLYRIIKAIKGSRNIWNMMPVCNSCYRADDISSYRGIAYSYDVKNEEDLYFDYQVEYENHITFLQGVVDQLVKEDDELRSNQNTCLLM